MRRMIWILVIIFILTSTHSALAKGTPDLVTVIGPGLDGEINVTDRDLRSALSLGGFWDLTTESIAAPDLDEDTSYLVTSRNKRGAGYQSWDHMRYYPHPAGERGYVLYVGLANGWSEYDGNWFRISRRGENAIRTVLAEHGIRLPGMAAGPARLPETGGVRWWPAAVTVLGAVLLLAGWQLRRYA